MSRADRFVTPIPGSAEGWLQRTVNPRFAVAERASSGDPS